MKKGATTGKGQKPKMDAQAFVDLIRSNKKVRSSLTKGWNEAIREGKKRGYKFSRKDLRDHLKKLLHLKSVPKQNEPDTCFCV